MGSIFSSPEPQHVNNGTNQNNNQVWATVQNTVEVHNTIGDTEMTLLAIITVCVVIELFINIYNQHNKRLKKKYRASTANLWTFLKHLYISWKKTIMEMNNLIIFLHMTCMLIQTIHVLFFAIQRYNKYQKEKFSEQMQEFRSINNKILRLTRCRQNPKKIIKIIRNKPTITQRTQIKCWHVIEMTWKVLKKLFKCA